MSSRSEINKKYRERKMQEDPEYLKKESDRRQANRVKQRRNRLKNKKKVELQNNQSKDDLVTNILEYNPDLKYDTARQYVNQTGAIFEAMYGIKFNYKNFDWLKKHKGVYDFINSYYTNLASRRTYIGRIYNLIQFFIGFEDYIDIYREYKNKIDNEYDELKDEGKLSQNESKLWIDYNLLLDMTTGIQDSRDNLLIQLYTRIPPRRTRAYSLLKVIRDTKDLNEIPREYNYAVFNKDNELVGLVLNQYKTVGKYGVYVIDNIPESVKKASKKYFEEYDLQIGNPLFYGRNRNNHYNNTAFSTVIKQTFKRYTGKLIGTTALRHSFISYWFQNNPNPTVRQQKQMSLKLGHSVLQMSGYNRFT
jgi:hypothetical protein